MIKLFIRNKFVEISNGLKSFCISVGGLTLVIAIIITVLTILGYPTLYIINSFRVDALPYVFKTIIGAGCLLLMGSAIICLIFISVKHSYYWIKENIELANKGEKVKSKTFSQIFNEPNKD